MNDAFLAAMNRTIVESATANGVNLSDHFADENEFKKHVIALSIDYVNRRGMPIDKAYDFVLGDGAYDRMKSMCWDALHG